MEIYSTDCHWSRDSRRIFEFSDSGLWRFEDRDCGRIATHRIRAFYGDTDQLQHSQHETSPRSHYHDRTGNWFDRDDGGFPDDVARRIEESIRFER